MSKDKIYIFDTTLRDGAQTEGVDFSIEDKNKIANVLSDIGVDYIEGGWPGVLLVFFSRGRLAGGRVSILSRGRLAGSC